MPIGDLAAAAGLPIVPESGPNASVRYGGREINRTRDQVAAAMTAAINNNPMINWRIQVGSATVNANNGTGTLDVTFPAAFRTSAVYVFTNIPMQSAGSAAFISRGVSITDTKFTAFVSGGGSGTVPITVQWVAFGPK